LQGEDFDGVEGGREMLQPRGLCSAGLICWDFVSGNRLLSQYCGSFDLILWRTVCDLGGTNERRLLIQQAGNSVLWELQTQWVFVCDLCPLLFHY